MDITVVEAPHSTAFTTLARVRSELGLTNTAQDARLTDLIEEVSADIVAYCNQPFIRQTVTERQVGFGRTVQTLSVTPVPHGGVTEARLRGVAVSGYSITDPVAGFIFRADRWENTRQYNQWIEADPAIMPGNPDWEFDYSGGYLLPGDDILASGISVANSADNSFELTDGITTWPILASGESVVVTGFETVGNNGRFTVLQRTLTKLYVRGTLVTESGSYVNYAVRTLPRDLERLAVQEIKGRFYSQRRDPSIKSESLGDWSASYGDGSTGSSSGAGGLSVLVALGLDKYVRVE